MRKALSWLVLLMLALYALAGCGAQPASRPNAGVPSEIAGSNQTGGVQIAFVYYDGRQETEVGQGVIKAIGRFSGEEGVTSGEYKATEDDFDSTLELAVKSGAKLVVMLGEEMAGDMERARWRYPNVNFILVDGTGQALLGANTVRLRAAVEQAGWLAGYAAVFEGYRELATFATDDPDEQRYALGFALGADAAAEELGLEAGQVRIRAVEGTGEEENTELRHRIERLAALGTELVFDTHSNSGISLLGYARLSGLRLVMVENPGNTETVLVTTGKDFQQGLYALLENWKASTFPGGQDVVTGAEETGVFLDVETAYFDLFSVADYETVLKTFDGGTVAVGINNELQAGEGELPRVDELPLKKLMVLLPAIPEETVYPASSAGPSGSIPVESSPAGADHAADIPSGGDAAGGDMGQGPQPESQPPEGSGGEAEPPPDAGRLGA